MKMKRLIKSASKKLQAFQRCILGNGKQQQATHTTLPPHQETDVRDKSVQQLEQAQTCVLASHPNGAKEITGSTDSSAHGMFDGFDSQAKHNYTSEPSKVRISHDGSKSCIAVFPTSSLMEKLQLAVLDRRELVNAQQEAEARLADLDQDFRHLRRDIHHVEFDIAEIEAEDSEHEQAGLDEMRIQALHLRQEQTDIDSERKDIKRRLDELFESHRAQQHDLFADLDSLFVNCNLLEPAASSGDDAAASILGDGRPEQTRSNSSTSGPSANAEDAGSFPTGNDHIVLHRKSRVDDLRSAAIPSRCLKQALRLQEPDPKELLLHQYRTKRTQLNLAERAFDARGDKVDQEAEERNRRLAAGEETESDTAFDIRQLESTRRLTHALIEAEAAYEKLKTEAVADGLQLEDSDLESGFVDDVEDGYRISIEEELCASVDPARALYWLQGIPEDTPSMLEDLSMAGSGTLGTEELCDIEADNWDAKTVEIADSRSMVAVGRARTRIEKWRATCASMGQNMYG